MWNEFLIHTVCIVSFPNTATVLLLTTCWRTWEQAQVCLVPDAFVSRPRCVRVSTQMRLCLDPRSLRVIIYFY